MNHHLPRCPRCHAVPLVAQLNQAAATPCWSCARPLQVLVFPALFRPATTSQAGAQRLATDEAGCFYHANKQAVVVCDSCGRFLCALCDVQLQDQHYCPSCLESGRKQNRLKQIERSRPLYDNVAIGLALAPLLFGCFLPVSPLAIGVAIWAWRKPSSLLPRTKVRFWIAILLSLVMLGGSVAVWYHLWKA